MLASRLPVQAFQLLEAFLHRGVVLVALLHQCGQLPLLCLPRLPQVRLQLVQALVVAIAGLPCATAGCGCSASPGPCLLHALHAVLQLTVQVSERAMELPEAPVHLVLQPGVDGLQVASVAVSGLGERPLYMSDALLQGALLLPGQGHVLAEAGLEGAQRVLAGLGELRRLLRSMPPEHLLDLLAVPLPSMDLLQKLRVQGPHHHLESPIWFVDDLVQVVVPLLKSPLCCGTVLQLPAEALADLPQERGETA
mmetsp:Transcript_101723/g.323234  ORF Transcript_101723/g.323234 Transcript_101723/m.323234 type:complete len:252 (+) Transcript_101723:324-1079(+)